MDSEHECGVCYRTYNAGLRCPRELHCGHSFCESCLLVLSRPRGADMLIVCPLCRHPTSISGEGRRVRAELRVDECILERLIASGVLDRQEEEEEVKEEEEDSLVRDGSDDNEEPAPPRAPAEESDFSRDSRGGRLRRCSRKVWRLIRGKDSGQRGGGICMNNDDLRNFAMMACFML
ncbi:E3 ubiquitin-protein ligase-like [Pseudoliparis swirei]|uniref:E3 ubiquitin-protein ligase-like n=1 Tax=Pseudoliparis swirei TaxID=2059687 RepID=UPI0024BDC922|nr:E3 ubiquitin-protein ligase-like [Pseudoliparis swirei]